MGTLPDLALSFVLVEYL